MEDLQGFETWARGATPRLLRLATLLTGSAADGEDVVQDVLVTVYRSWGRISRMARVDAYVTRMVVNRHLTARRGSTRRARREHLVAVGEARPGPEEIVGERDALTTALAGSG
ncbi:MAG: sigma factor [Mobilicoccus sp.]|nr:sigma factor [Mobilicoccus sp.]